MATEVASGRSGSTAASRKRKTPKVKVRLKFNKKAKIGMPTKVAGLSQAANARVARALDTAIFAELSSPAASKRLTRVVENAIAAELARQPRPQMSRPDPYPEPDPIEIPWPDQRGPWRPGGPIS
jgi:hypothetical protein